MWLLITSGAVPVGCHVQVDNEELVFSLEALVEKFGEQMAPYAVGLCHHLAGAFWRMALGQEGAGARPQLCHTACCQCFSVLCCTNGWSPAIVAVATWSVHINIGRAEAHERVKHAV